MQTSLTEKTQNSAHKTSTAQSKLLELKREFNVPVDQLYAAFTNANALKAWWWPEGIHADHIDYDFRYGGRYFINMKGFNDGSGGMTGEFEEIVKNKRIVMSDYFADEKGRAITAQEANMPGAWPAVVYITFDFESLGAKSSRCRLSQQGIPNDQQADCLKGWSQMFDKLEHYLGGRKN